MFWLLLALACSNGSPEVEGKPEEKGPKVDPRALVDVAAASRGAVSSTLTASGLVESEVQATLSPETTGRVTAIYAEEGEVIKKGQVLATLASPTLDAAFARASSELDRSELDYQTAKRLFDQNAISRAELDSAQRVLTAARTAHQEATRTRGFTRITSPISGILATRNLRVGELASPGPAFVVVDMEQLIVVVHLPERELARVQSGQKVTLTSAWGGSAEKEQENAPQATGSIKRIAPVVDPASGTFKVTIAIDPGQTVLRPGQYASARIEVDRHDGVLTLPRRALVWEEGKPSVFVLAEGPPPEKEEQKAEEEKVEEGKAEEGKTEEGGWLAGLMGGEQEEKKEEELPGPWRRAVKTTVTLGYEDGQLAEIQTGVAEGEQVVVVGNESLRDNSRVRLPGDPTVNSTPAEGTPSPEADKPQ